MRIKMKLSEILKGMEYELLLLSGEEEITNITTSPSECGKNTMLIISNAKNIRYEELADKSFLCVMCSPDASVPSHMPRIIVENARSALAYAYSNFYLIDYTKLKVIGITGTNGKTSTASFLERILKDNGIKVGLIGTGRISIDGEILSEENYSMTTPDPSLLYKSLKDMELSDCRYVIMEVSSHSLALHKVDPIPFEYAVMTNLSEEHLDFHSDIEDYFLTKCRLFSLCKTAVFNIDDAYCRRAYNEYTGRSIASGVLFRGDNYATHIEKRGFYGVEYLYHGKGFTFGAKLSVAGIYNVYNSMLAISVAVDIGIPPYKVKEAVASLELIEGRFEIIKSDITVIIDYAHTSQAFFEVLKNISEAKEGGELTVVFGAGGERDKGKRPKMAKTAEDFADKIIVTSDNSRGEEPLRIIEDIVSGFKRKRHSVCQDRRAAIRKAILEAHTADTVAVIGKGHEKYNIDITGYHTFDEREIIRSALLERKNEN